MDNNSFQLFATAKPFCVHGKLYEVHTKLPLISLFANASAPTVPYYVLPKFIDHPNTFVISLVRPDVSEDKAPSETH
jgi:hypothetical protein